MVTVVRRAWQAGRADGFEAGFWGTVDTEENQEKLRAGMRSLEADGACPEPKPRPALCDVHS